jgi:hypothetical protein
MVVHQMGARYRLAIKAAFPEVTFDEQWVQGIVMCSLFLFLHERLTILVPYLMKAKRDIGQIITTFASSFVTWLQPRDLTLLLLAIGKK